MNVENINSKSETSANHERDTNQETEATADEATSTNQIQNACTSTSEDPQCGTSISSPNSTSVVLNVSCTNAPNRIIHANREQNQVKPITIPCKLVRRCNVIIQNNKLLPQIMLANFQLPTFFVKCNFCSSYT